MNATNTIENLFSKKKPNWVKKCRLVLLLLVFTFMQDEITKISLSHGFAILQNCYSGKAPTNICDWLLTWKYQVESMCRK